MIDSKLMKIEDFHQRVEVLGGIVAYLLMIGLFVIGFCEIGKGILIYFHIGEIPEWSTSRESAALEMSLKGLEFLFLAPLSYLALLSLKRYLTETRDEDAHHVARLQLTNVKISITSLMIAVISADLVAKILSKGGLTYGAIFTEGLAIIILGAYFFCLERLTGQSSRGSSSH